MFKKKKKTPGYLVIFEKIKDEKQLFFSLNSLKRAAVFFCMVSFLISEITIVTPGVD